MALGRSPQPARRRLQRIRSWLSPINFLILLVAAVLLAISFGTQFQPVDPYHRAALSALQSALAELPPYPGAEAGKPLVKAGPVDIQTSLLVGYGTPATCADVQAYYVGTATGAGWRVRYLDRTLKSGPPVQELLDSSYVVQEQGFNVELLVECFVNTSFQSGYTILLQTPPDPSP